MLVFLIFLQYHLRIYLRKMHENIREPKLKEEILAKLAEDLHAYCSSSLIGVDLSGADLTNVDFFDTDLTNAKYLEQRVVNITSSVRM